MTNIKQTVNSVTTVATNANAKNIVSEHLNVNNTPTLANVNTNYTHKTGSITVSVNYNVNSDTYLNTDCINMFEDDTENYIYTSAQIDLNDTGTPPSKNEKVKFQEQTF